MWSLRRTSLFAILSLFAVFMTTEVAAAPTSIVVEGILTSNGGGPVADGQYALSFGLYSVPNGGTAAWSEGPTKVAVKGGQFTYALGTTKPITSTLLQNLSKAWFGIQVGNDPELPRQMLRSVAYALQASSADALACSGCIKAAQIAKSAVTANNVGFPFAGSSTKGGPAAKALDLVCTACVSVAEMKFDNDVNFGDHAIQVKKVTATQIVGTTVSAGTVTASAFIGDGSKLTGIVSPNGTCKTAGEVVKGINPDGSLQCVKAMNPKALPFDGLDEISNGQLSVEFDHVTAITKAVPIPDNNPIGVSSDITVPDVGVVKTLLVRAKISSSDISKLTVQLFDPTNKKYELFKGGASGKLLDTAWPIPSKLVDGDLGLWVGKNAKGKWRMKVVDHAFTNNTFDGAIDTWSVELHTVSASQVATKGQLLVEKGVDFRSSGTAGFRFEVTSSAPVTCDAAHVGYVYYDKAKGNLMLCEGKTFQAIAQLKPGASEEAAGKSCLALKQKGVNKSGVYWLNPTGKVGAAYQGWCDQTTDGGGWTLVMRFKNDAGFVFGSAYWTNTSLLDAKSFDPSVNSNAKYNSFLSVSGTTVRGCKGVSTGCQKQSWTGAKTALTLFKEGYKSGSISRSAMNALFGNDPYQPHCNKSGINTDFTYSGARFGLVGNNENDCNTCDSGWGWGTFGKSNKSIGCGCGLAGWQVANKCYQGTLWVR